MNYIKSIINKYNIFLKYLLVAGISFIIDVFLFTIFNSVLEFKIIISTILARVISSFINYLFNNGIVFKSNESKLKTVIKYYLLVVFQMLLSALVVDKLYDLIKINATIIKVPVEFILFMCNYIIQKLVIFKRGSNENNQK